MIVVIGAWVTVWQWNEAGRSRLKGETIFMSVVFDMPLSVTTVLIITFNDSSRMKIIECSSELKSLFSSQPHDVITVRAIHSGVSFEHPRPIIAHRGRRVIGLLFC